MIVDCAIYVDGSRDAMRTPSTTPSPTPAGAAASCGSVSTSPPPQEFDDVTRAFDLHPLAVEDAIHAHQRPKLERYGDSLFVVLKPARYVDCQEVIEVDQIMVFVGADFVVTVRHGASDGAHRRAARPWSTIPSACRGGPGRCSTPSPTRSSTTTAP